jgi:hypothetical protein
VVIENYLGREKCTELQNECDRIIESNHFLDEVNKIAVFEANETDSKVLNLLYIKKKYSIA